MVRILTTLLHPDEGRATVAGFDVVRQAEELRHVIGLAGQYAAVDENLTGQENLEMVGRLYHLPTAEARRRATEVLERFDLTDAADRTAKTYSGGMRRRLDLGASLVGRPKVLFLDEPTTGLDPRSRLEMWDIIRELVADGVTILLTTQYLEEADRLAGRIALLDGGRVVAQGTPTELKRLVPGGSVRLEFDDEAALERAARAIGDGSRDDQGLALELPNDGGVHSLRALLDRLDAASIDVAGLSVQSADLDDVFLSLTGRDNGHHADEKVPTP
jgi:ABC-2 type transport system ATP-binding protein